MDLKKLQAIKQGWGNFLFPSPEIEELANVRAKICSSCDKAVDDYPFKHFLPEEKRIEIVRGLACGACGCPLSAKIRQVVESCPHPDKKW